VGIPNLSISAAAGLAAARARRPWLPQVACIDTALHETSPANPLLTKFGAGRVHRADERRLSGAAVQQISRERSGVRIEAFLADEELKIARHTAAMSLRAADF